MEIKCNVRIYFTRIYAGKHVNMRTEMALYAMRVEEMAGREKYLGIILAESCVTSNQHHINILANLQKRASK